MEPARLREGPRVLLGRALGAPAEIPRKVMRLGRVLAGALATGVLRERLERLHGRGVIEAVPGRVQLVLGSYDMRRFGISPAAAQYYRDRGISYRFHQV